MSTTSVPDRATRAEAIRSNPDGFRIDTEADDAAYAYTRVLVRTPGEVRPADLDRLRAAGFDDLDILDLNSLVAYYCYINRVAAGLGLQREA